MAKLDMVGTVTESYKGAWSHFGDMVKLVWAPVVVYIAANILHSLSVQSITEEIDPSDMEAMFQASWGWQAAAVTLLGQWRGTGSSCWVKQVPQLSISNLAVGKHGFY